MPGVLSMFEHRGIDPDFNQVRETPTRPLFRRPPDQGDGLSEPELLIEDIQGNSIVGFNKAHQTLLFYHIDDATLFKPTLRELGRQVATAEEVLAFNRLFKRMRDRRGFSGPLEATWTNIAFSSAGLAKLTSPRDVELFADPSFRGGLVSRPEVLGDPAEWLLKDGPGEDAADVVIIVASDAADDLEDEVARLQALVANSGVRLVWRENGRVLSTTEAARDHFGFMDGISQPGLRGRVSALADDFMTAREVGGNPDQGKPGQELVWPGEFVFGYPDQDGGRDPTWIGDWTKDGAGFAVAPPWARNGSFLVFGRLRQNVFNFHRFLEQNRKVLDAMTGRREEAAAVGARVIGRWPSGAPLVRTPQADDGILGGNDQANNYFGFVDSTPSFVGSAGTVIPAAEADPEGNVCPGSAHIRKANPRDQVARPSDRLRHRLVRRGIPYGNPSGSSLTDLQATDDGVDRGLLFLGYMTSIVDQFEFVMDKWIRAPAFPLKEAGPDRLLAGADQDWITPTAGGYYFAPSISALCGRLST